MKLAILAVLAINIVGCATYWDSQDPCQIHNRSANYKPPSFCGASAANTQGRYVTRDYYTWRTTSETKYYPR